jgi:HK97 family phage prohead protease
VERLTFDKVAHKDAFRRFNLPTSAVTFAQDGQALRLKGYFLVWGVLSSDRGGYLVRFAKGGMRLPSYDVVAYYNHDDNIILAREDNGSLAISQDDKGGYMEATLVDGTFEKDLVKRVESGLIKGMSCGLYAIKTHMEKQLVLPEDAAGNPDLTPFVGLEVDVEVWDECLLDEVTITPRPAFQQTSVESFNKEEPQEEPAEIEADNANYEYEAELIGMSLD